MLEPAERRNLIHNNNNMVYTPSLMNIPEYPESILSSYTFANDGTGMVYNKIPFIHHQLSIRTNLLF